MNNEQRRLWDHGRGVCWYCACQLSAFGSDKRNAATIDHYMPKALGGTNAFHNQRLACWPCNNRKGDIHPDAYETLYPRQIVVPALSRQERRQQLLASCAAVRKKPIDGAVNKAHSTDIATGGTES